MNSVLAWLATYAVHSTLLLGAVAVLTRFLVRRETWRETLWKVALLGGLLTASLQLALGVRPLVGRVELPQAAPIQVAAVAALGSVPPQSLAAGEGAGAIPGSPAFPDAGPAVPFPDPAASRADLPARLPPWPVWALAAWGAIAGFGIARLVRKQALLRRLLRDRREVTDPSTLAMLAQLRRNAGIWRMVRLCSTARASTPFAVGSSEICVPERLFHALTPEERRCALAHELAHLARRDPHWQLAAGVMEAVFFFQPLNRLAAHRLREAAEFLADDWAVRHTGSAMGLARCLAAVASWVTGEEEAIPRFTMAMAEGGSPLLKRV